MKYFIPPAFFVFVCLRDRLDNFFVSLFVGKAILSKLTGSPIMVRGVRGDMILHERGDDTLFLKP